MASLLQSKSVLLLLAHHLKVWASTGSHVTYVQDENAYNLHPILCTLDAVTAWTPVIPFFPLGVWLCSKEKRSQSELIFKVPTTTWGVPPGHIFYNLITNALLDANADRKPGKFYWLFAKSSRRRRSLSAWIPGLSNLKIQEWVPPLTTALPTGIPVSGPLSTSIIMPYVISATRLMCMHSMVDSRWVVNRLPSA